MFFNKKYSDYNDEVSKIEKPKEEDFNVKKKDVESIYKQRNEDYREIVGKEKYSSAGMGKTMCIFFAILAFAASIGGFINNSISGGVIFLIVGIVFIIVGFVMGENYKTQVEAKEITYKQMEVYNDDMGNFVTANDEYNDKVFEIKKPYLKQMEEEIKKYDYLQLKNTMIECYKRLGLQVYSTGIRKFGGVVLRACDEKDYNVAVVIFPYDNPISGYTIQKLGEVIKKINHKIDSVHIISRYGEYKYDNYIGLLLLKPYTIMDAFDIATYIWNANTSFYSQTKNKKEGIEEKKVIVRESNTKSAFEQKIIKWAKVHSSSVKESYYNLETKTLYLKFNSGDIYAYFEVEKTLYLDFLKSTSKGRFVQSELYKYKYKRVKIEEVI